LTTRDDCAILTALKERKAVIMQELQDTINAMVSATIIKANQKLMNLGSSQQIPIQVPVIYFERESHTFAIAIREASGKMYIKFNLRNAQLNPHLIPEVISHEVSHLACFLVGHKGHDYFWSIFDRSIGGKGETHIKGVRHENLYKYSCGCQIHDVSKRKHNMIQNDSVVYICKRCKRPLVFVMTPEESKKLANQEKVAICA